VCGAATGNHYQKDACGTTRKAKKGRRQGKRKSRAVPTKKNFRRRSCTQRNKRGGGDVQGGAQKGAGNFNAKEAGADKRGEVNKNGGLKRWIQN